MENPFDPFSDPEMLELVRRFEEMADSGDFGFFDLDEFEDILEYYLFHSQTSHIQRALNMALKQHPGSISIRLKEAQHNINTNREQKALRILEETEDLVSDLDTHLIIGALYSQLNKYEKAIEAYKKGIHESEDLDEIYASIAYEYENLGKFDKAITYLIKALNQNPGNEPALFELCFCCEINQQTEKIITYLTQFLDQHPYNKSAWFNLGIAYSNMELYEKAINAYEYTLAIDEKFSSAYFNMANCYANIKKYGKAIETYLETFHYEEPEPLMSLRSEIPASLSQAALKMIQKDVLHRLAVGR